MLGKSIITCSVYLSSSFHLELVLKALESFHHHAHGFHGALQSAVHTIEAVHAA